MSQLFVASSSQGLIGGNLVGPGYPRSFSMWVKFNSIASVPLWFCMSDGSNNVYVFINTGLSNKVILVDGGGLAQVTSNNPVSGTGVWVHVVGVFTGANDRTLYLDNDPATNTDLGGVMANTLTVSALGQFWNGSIAANYFDGLISDFAMWNTALTAADVNALFNGASPKMVRTSDLKVYFQLKNGNISSVTAQGGTFSNSNGSTASSDNPRIYQ